MSFMELHRPRSRPTADAPTALFGWSPAPPPCTAPARRLAVCPRRYGETRGQRARPGAGAAHGAACIDPAIRTGANAISASPKNRAASFATPAAPCQAPGKAALSVPASL